jgi:primosomal protein N' (replication factor Y)
VPGDLRDQMQVGLLVTIPFRHRTTSGIVVDTIGDPDVDRVLDLQRIVDPSPVILPHQLTLAHWIHSEYAAPLSDVLGVMLPPSVKHPSTSRPVKRVAAAEITDAGRAAFEADSLSKSARSQRRLLEQLKSSSDPVPIAELLGGKTSVTAWMKSLEKAGLIRLISRVASPGRGDSHPHVARDRILSPHQAHAVLAVVKTLRHADSPPSSRDPKRLGEGVFLLHGVTGSGKTEVYMSIIQEVLEHGQDALVLVPEISLTPQATERFTQRFPGLVASLHSEMGLTERHDQWGRLRSGEARIAIGPRSALFAPLANLGIIILDEEHDGSYKQGESPRYHARDVAIHLADMLGIPCLLGSATPDVATYYQARKGRITLLELPDRPQWTIAGDAYLIGDSDHSEGTVELPPRPMPSVEIVDLRQELKAGNRGIFSRLLLSAMETTIDAGHQVLLFLNRRGTATSVVCRDCGYVATCEACDIPLTYHATTRKVICHRCDRRYAPPKQCPTCGNERIRYLGVGTQRVAEEVSRLMPHARVQRWDRDVATRKGAHEAITSAFSRHEVDVLVGTQMIAKGLDFPLVTLVGVVVADVGLNLPDFRSAERTFQLMTQVAGRAGRVDIPSNVIIQAYNPEHYALLAAKDHDYWAFYRQEMTFRHEAGYPPYSRLVRFLLRGKDDMIVGRQAHALRDEMLERAESHPNLEVEVIGPAPAFASRVNEQFQWHLLLRGPELHDLLHDLPDDVIVDVDPVDLL